MWTHIVPCTYLSPQPKWHLNRFSSFCRAHYCDRLTYRAGHSTKTALLDVLDGVYTAADNKQISVLISLDLSATFDTVDHSLLIDRLQSEFRVTNTLLDWLRSYLSGREQFAKIGQHQSDDAGILQGSVLGPLLFAMYCSPFADVIFEHGISYHQYADDTPIKSRQVGRADHRHNQPAASRHSIFIVGESRWCRSACGRSDEGPWSRCGPSFLV